MEVREREKDLVSLYLSLSLSRDRRALYACASLCVSPLPFFAGLLTGARVLNAGLMSSAKRSKKRRNRLPAVPVILPHSLVLSSYCEKKILSAY